MKKMYDARSKAFDSKCLSCHIKKDYTTEEVGMNFMEKNKILNLKAPVLSQLSFKLNHNLVTNPRIWHKINPSKALRDQNLLQHSTYNHKSIFVHLGSNHP